MPSRSVIWLFPLAFVVHDGEEVMTMAQSILEHRAHLDRLAELGPVPAAVIANLPTSNAQVAVAVAFELILVLMSTAAVAWTWRRGPALYVFSSLLGAFALHSLGHYAQAIYVRAYTTGLITALIIPAATYPIYQHLLQTRLLTPRTAAATAALGIVLLPIVIIAHSVGRLAFP